MGGELVRGGRLKEGWCAEEPHWHLAFPWHLAPTLPALLRTLQPEGASLATHGSLRPGLAPLRAPPPAPPLTLLAPHLFVVPQSKVERAAGGVAAGLAAEGAQQETHS